MNVGVFILWLLILCLAFFLVYVKACIKASKPVWTERVSPRGETYEPQNPLKPPEALIFSDVDDTLKPSGGRPFGNIAGMDRSYSRSERDALYPGMARFLYELCKLCNPGRERPEDIPKIHFLSARPFGRLSGLQTRLRDCSGISNWGANSAPHVVLHGRKRDTTRHLPWHRDKMFRDYGETKYRNLSKFAKSGNFKIFFLGDNGQGDVVTATRIVEDPELSSRLIGIFVHEVVELTDDSEYLKDPRVIYYRNVIDLMTAINQSPIQVKFSKVMRQAVEQAFLDDFMYYSFNAGTKKNAAQFIHDKAIFQQLSGRDRVHNNSFIDIDDRLFTCL